MAESRTVLELVGPSSGGIRRHVAELTNRLTDLRWTATTAGPSLDPYAPGHAHTVVPLGGVGSMLGARRSFRAAATDADLVHAHGLRAGWLAASTRRPIRPLVVTVHNLVIEETAGRALPILRALEARLPRRCDALIAVSPAIAERFAGGPGAARITVIPPFSAYPVVVRDRAAIRNELAISPHVPLIACVARLHPQKGLDTLFTAFAQVLARIPEAKLVVVGEGPQREELSELIAQLGMTNSVTLTGGRDDAVDFMAASDLVAITSVWESGPLTLIEALALRVPVVATPAGMVPDYIEDGVTGRLVPVGNATAIADAIVEVLTDERCARFAEAGFERMQSRHDPAELTRRVVEVYDRVLESP